MNIETLKVFRDLAECGSFSKTAGANYISQSAVSQQLKKLELVLKCNLFTRPAGKLILTPAGEKFYETAKKIAVLYDSSLSAIKTIASEKNSGELKFSSIYSAGLYSLQGHLGKFMARHPGTKVSVEYRHFSQIHGDVLSGRADFGLLACPARKLRGLVLVPFGKDEMVLVSSSGHALSQKRTVDLRAVAGADFILFDKAFPSRRFVDMFFNEHGIHINVKLELDNIETIKTAVTSGAGLSILPASAVKQEVRAKTLRAIRFSDGELSRQLYLVHSAQRKLPVIARAFLDMVNNMRIE